MAADLAFDTERFIHEIKERPCLWDFSSDDYSNRILKKQKWEEMMMLFGGDCCTSAAEKNELCASLQKKWRHIKDAFNREKRRITAIKSGSGASRKSQYIYYNMLSFLHSATPPINTQQSLAQESDARDPDGDLQIEGTEQNIDCPSTSEKQAYHTTVLAKKRKSQDDIGKQLVSVLKESVNDRRQLEKENNDEDRLFLMSLVKDFKNIPQHKKLSAKREILLVIEQHQSGYSDITDQFQQAPKQTSAQAARQAPTQTLRFPGLTKPRSGIYRVYNQGTVGNNYEIQTTQPSCSVNEGDSC